MSNTDALPGGSHLSSIAWTPIATSLLGALAIVLWRMRESQRPVTARTIVIPPVMMSTGLFMFVRPEFHMPWTWAAGAFLAGALLLSYPLVRSTRLLREGGAIVMHRSRAFLVILIGLVAVRVAARSYVGQILPVTQTAAMFFLLAFGMIVRWRIWMFGEYRRLTT